MQQSVPSATSPGSASFAGLLAALTSPAKKGPTDWNDDDLADDVATLSYEHALRTHSRYKPPDLTDQALTQSRNAESAWNFEELSEEPAPPPRIDPVMPLVETEVEAAPELSSVAGRNLKNSSITIRLSKAECAQLRMRAAEAGITVSAYMRSCAFETESLRALVKDALAQMRSGPATPNQTVPIQAAKSAAADTQRSWQRWLGYLLPHARTGQLISGA